jgi:hypothetical protein
MSATINNVLQGIDWTLSSWDKDFIKEFIGDSTNNTRTLTANQLVRFLSNMEDDELNFLGDKVRIARKLLLNAMREDRINAELTRTDAFSVTELQMALVQLSDDELLNTVLRDNQ